MTTTSPAAFVHPANLLTYASLLAGLAAVAAARHGSGAAAGALLAIAVVADTFDGRFARRFARNADLARLGVELDSLADAVTFGVVPLVCVSMLQAPSTLAAEGLWWTAAFAYLVCALTRLGFYNVSHEQVKGFIGLPSPVAALTWATVMVATPARGPAIASALITGALMISPLPVPRPSGPGLAAFLLWPVAIIGLAWIR
jgi:CDP-diacylglycerol--serine O-phosphatidyltransferase